ncbi:putative uncharacterized protein DDB_G0271606 [Rhagoletis pomonella]|uniref:putative uncharacterized protein DDB_G0271606 n=1 Tax=Rhagoletis pomonella TaxID=28610 RepID=UPI0017869873|nr:putative uncharacterized protein DDB_G0271606 [Rhagoletis pomonella]
MIQLSLLVGIAATAPQGYNYQVHIGPNGGGDFTYEQLQLLQQFANQQEQSSDQHQVLTITEPPVPVLSQTVAQPTDNFAAALQQVQQLVRNEQQQLTKQELVSQTVLSQQQTQELAQPVQQQQIPNTVEPLITFVQIQPQQQTLFQPQPEPQLQQAQQQPQSGTQTQLEPVVLQQQTEQQTQQQLQPQFQTQQQMQPELQPQAQPQLEPVQQQQQSVQYSSAQPPPPAVEPAQYQPTTVSVETRVPAQYNKEFYYLSAPQEDNELPHDFESQLNKIKKKLRVLFIKAPEQNGLERAALQLAKEAQNSQTAIYVLTKQHNAEDLADKLQQQRVTSPQKPEVVFVKYRTPAEAEQAQRTIQAQYESLNGPNHFNYEGVVPTHNFVGSLADIEPRQRPAKKSAPAEATTVSPVKYLPPAE